MAKNIRGDLICDCCGRVSSTLKKVALGTAANDFEEWCQECIGLAEPTCDSPIIVTVSMRCPECNTVMEFTDDVWTEAPDLVVVRIHCPNCDYRDDVHLRPLKLPPEYEQERQPISLSIVGGEPCLSKS
jgi:hypothetical protein